MSISSDPLGTGARRFMAEFNSNAVPQGDQTCRPEPAKVTSMSPGSGKITVYWRGQNRIAPYLSSYSPTVNDIVIVLVTSPAGLLVLGKPA